MSLLSLYHYVMLCYNCQFCLPDASETLIAKFRANHAISDPNQVEGYDLSNTIPRLRNDIHFMKEL